jgi:hypothetical protein
MLNLSLASWGKNVLLGMDFALQEMPRVFWHFREMPEQTIPNRNVRLDLRGIDDENQGTHSRA